MLWHSMRAAVESIAHRIRTCPTSPLLSPIHPRHNRPQIAFGHGIRAGQHNRQEQQFFLDGWSQMQQVENLRHARLRDSGKPSQRSLAGDDAFSAIELLNSRSIRGIIH